MATTDPRFRIKKDNSGYYYWIFYSDNSKAIARSSESYVAKRDCLHSIALVKSDGPAAPVFDWTVPADAHGNYSALSEAQVV